MLVDPEAMLMGQFMPGYLRIGLVLEQTPLTAGWTPPSATRSIWEAA